MKIKNEKIICIFWAFAVCLSAAVGTAQAQQTPIAENIVKADGNAGELNSARLDFLAVEQQEKKERIFVIARLGRGETARSLNLKRLEAARSYLVETRGVEKEQVIFAEGEKATGEGRLEFYLGGRLMLVSLAERRRNVRLICCVD